MWDWKAVGSPRLACSISISSSGLSQVSTSLRGQWSVCSAKVIGYRSAIV